MKIYIYIIFFFIFTFNLYSAGDSLIAYWSFDDETARDFSGNGYDGTIVNHPTVIDGISGKAFHFQGKGYQINQSQSVTEIGDHILLPPIDLTKYAGFTVSLWVREQDMIDIGEAYLFFGHYDRGWLGIQNHYIQYEGLNQFYLQFTTRATVFNNIIRYKFDQSYRNKWMHYAMVYYNNTLDAFVNGNKVGSISTSVQYSLEHSALCRSWWSYSGEERSSARFTGDIDEVKIFNKALSDEEVKKLANPCQDYFTLAFEDNKSLGFDSVTYATTNCKQISITNISDSPQNLDKVFLKYNIDFSIPQSQLPLVLLPHETKTIAVCFTPTKLGNIVDTLLIPNNCDSLLIPLSGIGSPNYYNAPSKCDVKLAGKTIDILNGGYLINSHLNYNINTENIDVSLVFNLNKSPNFPIQYSIYNYYGQAEMEGSQIVSSEIIGNNTIKANFNIPTNNLKNSLFLLVLKFQGNVLNYKFLKY
jgi:hypothetical protein